MRYFGPVGQSLVVLCWCLFFCFSFLEKSVNFLFAVPFLHPGDTFVQPFSPPSFSSSSNRVEFHDRPGIARHHFGNPAETETPIIVMCHVPVQNSRGLFRSFHHGHSQIHRLASFSCWTFTKKKKMKEKIFSCQPNVP